jgi:3-isopropylmalate dehydrogenase
MLTSTGPEVTGEAVRVLQAVIKHTDLDIALEHKDFGGAAIDAAGDPLPEDTLKSCQEADAILLGTLHHTQITLGHLMWS